MNAEFIAHWTKMRRSIERSSASVPSQHDPFLAAFIANIAGLDFQHTG
jgi:hypothetical protein